VSVPPRKMNP